MRHIKLLLWKNYILQLRHPWVTLFEVIIPCLFVASIAIIRVQVEVTPYDNSTFYPSFDIYNVPNQTNPEDKSPFKYVILYSPENDTYPLIMQNVVDKLRDLNDKIFEQKFKRRYTFQGNYFF